MWLCRQVQPASSQASSWFYQIYALFPDCLSLSLEPHFIGSVRLESHLDALETLVAGIHKSSV